VGKANGVWAIERQNETGGVEVRLGKNVVFKWRAMAELHGPTTREGRVPNLGEPRRIVVAKRAVLDHEKAPSNGRFRLEQNHSATTESRREMIPRNYRRSRRSRKLTGLAAQLVASRGAW
jgi:hypothetical protein